VTTSATETSLGATTSPDGSLMTDHLLDSYLTLQFPWGSRQVPLEISRISLREKQYLKWVFGEHNPSLTIRRATRLIGLGGPRKSSRLIG